MLPTFSSLRTDLIERLKHEDFVVMPGTELEYLDIAFEFPHKIEYHQSEIIAMGLSSFYHEIIVGKLIILLHAKLNPELYYIVSSNGGVHIPNLQSGIRI